MAFFAGCSGIPLTGAHPKSPGLAGSAPSSITGTIFVADQQANAIVEFPLSARGNHAPLARIAGSDTRLNSPSDVAVDPNGTIDSPNYLNAEVDEFASDANGNVAPIAVIAGSLTQLALPEAITIDATGRIYVRNRERLTEYAPGATGNVAPVAVLSGPKTHINGDSAAGIAVDAGGELYALNNDANAVDIFAAGANGNVSPAKRIKGSLTQLAAMSDLTIDAAGTVYVLQHYLSNGMTEGDILEFPPQAFGNVPPNRIIQGALTTLTTANSLAIDPKGRLFVSQGRTIVVFAPGANGNVSPSYVIRGSLTQLNGPAGLIIR